MGTAVITGSTEPWGKPHYTTESRQRAAHHHTPTSRTQPTHREEKKSKDEKEQEERDWKILWWDTRFDQIDPEHAFEICYGLV